MNAKIFVHRQYNPTKGKVDIPNAPSRPHSPHEDHAITRELRREAEAMALEKRAQALVSTPVKQSKRYNIEIVTPEWVEAFHSLTRSMKRILRTKPEYQHMYEINEWLDKYKDGAKASCFKCKFDITVTEKGNVPYGIIVLETNPLTIEGLCSDCHQSYQAYHRTLKSEGRAYGKVQD